MSIDPNVGKRFVSGTNGGHRDHVHLELERNVFVLSNLAR